MRTDRDSDSDRDRDSDSDRDTDSDRDSDRLRLRLRLTGRSRRFKVWRKMGPSGLWGRLLVTLGLLAVAGAVEAKRAEKSRKPAASSLGTTADRDRGGPAIHVQRFGKGPAVVFLHGLGADSSVFIEEMQRLEPAHTVLLVDLPGHGQSKAAPPHIELPAIARQIAELIDAQRVGPAVVVGHSLGGTLAGYVALEGPKVVRGLVIVDAMFAPYPIPDEDIDKLRFQLGRDQAQALRGFFGPIAKDARQLDKIVASARRVRGETLVAYLDFVSERDDLRRRAREITVPVHVMASPLLTENQRDPARVQLALSQVGFQGIPNLTYDHFPNAKHWIFWDDPQGFHASLEKFLRRVEGPEPVAAAPAAEKPARSGKKARSLARAAHTP